MGVDNLMAFVKDALTQTHVTDIGLANSTVAIDVSHWIYRATYKCAEQLYFRSNMNEVYNAILSFIENFVRLFEHHQVKMIFVFDGMRVPAKKLTHLDRAARKAEAKRLVEQYLASGNHEAARKKMASCLEVRFDIVQQIITYCKRKGIDYIVAPYEADAQLAFLNNEGICDFVITEDTDLIPYGCQRIVYKLDHQSGSCVLYERSKLSKCFQATRDELEFDKFRRICIMSGCDYIKSIHGIGLQKAKKFFLMTHQDNLKLLLYKIPAYLKAPSLKGKVTDKYVSDFIQAELTFKHHIVYDPVSQRLRPLEPYPRGKSSSDFPLAGKRFHSTLAKAMVRGEINLDTLNPDTDLDSASDAELGSDDDDGSATVTRGGGGDTDKANGIGRQKLHQKRAVAETNIQ